MAEGKLMLVKKDDCLKGNWVPVTKWDFLEFPDPLTMLLAWYQIFRLNYKTKMDTRPNYKHKSTRHNVAEFKTNFINPNGLALYLELPWLIVWSKTTQKTVRQLQHTEYTKQMKGCMDAAMSPPPPQKSLAAPATTLNPLCNNRSIRVLPSHSFCCDSYDSSKSHSSSCKPHGSCHEPRVSH